MSVVASASGMVLGKIMSVRVLFILILAVIALIVIYKLVKKVADPAESDADTAKDISKDLEKEIDKESLSYSPSVYKQLALVVFNALDGATEDEDVVYSVFKQMKTNSDVLQLIKEFGYRKATTWGWLTNFNVQGTLPVWISRLFDEDEISTINEILTERGLTYQF